MIPGPTKFMPVPLGEASDESGGAVGAEPSVGTTGGEVMGGNVDPEPSVGGIAASSIETISSPPVVDATNVQESGQPRATKQPQGIGTKTVVDVTVGKASSMLHEYPPVKQDCGLSLRNAGKQAPLCR
jgi:hypothetical protein